jgi:aspartate-semialdehyde dehydrogenase
MITNDYTKAKLKESKELNDVLAQLCKLSEVLFKERQVAYNKMLFIEEQIDKIRTEETKVNNQILKLKAKRDNKLFITVP